MKLVRIALGLLVCHCASGTRTPPSRPSGSGCEGLSPATSRLTDPDPGFARRESLISATLLARAASQPGEAARGAGELVVVMVKEGHGPEEAVYVLRTSREQYSVVHARANEPILFQTTPVGATFTEAPIGADIVRELGASWGLMALGARWPDRTSRIAQMRWGAAFYTFDYRGDNIYGQGDTVSPAAGTCSRALVNLAELLIRYADEKNEAARRVTQDEILRQSRALAARLGAR